MIPPEMEGALSELLCPQLELITLAETHSDTAERLPGLAAPAGRHRPLPMAAKPGCPTCSGASTTLQFQSTVFPAVSIIRSR